MSASPPDERGSGGRSRRPAAAPAQPVGRYRVTASWVEPHGDGAPSWLVHIEQIDAYPAPETVLWRYQEHLGDLDALARRIAARTPNRPDAQTVGTAIVLPADMYGQLGPLAQATRARRLRRATRRTLVKLGMADVDAEVVVVALATPGGVLGRS